jgi:large subunit ribosomal protein L22
LNEVHPLAYQASHRFARIAPRKARLVADMIRGMNVDEALTALDFEKKRGSAFISVVLKSAIANAEEKNADPTKLFVSESRVDEGPTLDRFQPKDRGRAHPIRKRTSHIHVAVEERGA